MNLKITLIILTVVSVVADTMILPFYPQFFEQEFGITDSAYVGYYIATCCFTVMVTFPLWAKVAKRINELHLWVYTQLVSACFGYICFSTDSLLVFWISSQLMLICKASYLLIYPFCMRLEEHDQHLNIAGLFSILMHFSAIGGALIGGFVMKIYDPRDLYLVMIAADILQVFVCFYLINKYQFPLFQTADENDSVEEENTIDQQALKNGKSHIFAIGTVFLVLYFASFLSRPFFTSYWEVVTSNSNAIISGFIYSLPAWVALLALWINKRSDQQKQESKTFSTIISALLLGGIGLGLHAIDHIVPIIIGRCLFGWAMFQASVRLEVLIFKFSPKQDYSSDFSIVHLFQNIGVLIASFAVGWIVKESGLKMTFIISSIGFLMAAIVYLILFRNHVFKSKTKAVSAL